MKIGGIINGYDHAKHATNGRSKYPPAFGIDVLVDDLPGVVLEGERCGFRVIQVGPKNEQWVETVLAGLERLEIVAVIAATAVMLHKGARS